MLPRSVSHTGAIFAFGLLASTASAQQSPPTYELKQIGLTGAAYSYTSSGGTVEEVIAQQLNAAGQVRGVSTRYDPSGYSLGQDVWLYSGGTTQQIGFTGTGYSYVSTSNGVGTVQNSSAIQLNGAGQVVGITDRYNASGTSLGADAWLYSGGTTQQLGLTGAVYSYTTTANGGGTVQNSSASQLNAAGQVLGFSVRFNASGTRLGQDAWLYSGGITQQIGLTGANYSYAYSGTGGGTVQNTSFLHLNDAGQVVGANSRYTASGTSLGQDAWLYSGGTTQQIGFTGANYSYTASGGGTFQQTFASLLNSAGQVAGNSSRYNASGSSLGQDAWLYSGGTTQQIGLTGADYSYTSTANGGGTFQSSSLSQLNAAGQVIGVNSRFNASGTRLGEDAWLYSGGTTQQLGLTGTNYSYPSTGAGSGTYRDSSPSQLNAVGQVAGVSARYNASGTSLGQDAWFYSGGITQQIGLTGGNYSYVSTATGGGTAQSSTVFQVNAFGQVVGTSARYTASGASLGTATWFYDPSTSTSSELAFSFRSDGYSYTVPSFLTDTGIVLGYYELYNGSTDAGSRAFYWNKSDGFADLGSLVAGGLGPQGWQSLSDVYGPGVPGAIGTTPDGDPQLIVGLGQILGQGSGDSVYLATANTPEPAGLALLAVCTAALSTCRRARRVT